MRTLEVKCPQQMAGVGIQFAAHWQCEIQLTLSMCLDFVHINIHVSNYGSDPKNYFYHYHRLRNCWGRFLTFFPLTNRQPWHIRFFFLNIPLVSKMVFHIAWWYNPRAPWVHNCTVLWILTYKPITKNICFLLIFN